MSNKNVNGIRRYFASLLNEEQNSNKMAKLVQSALFTLIFVNVIVIMLESVASIEQEYFVHFRLFEQFSVFIFTIEYMIRVWVCIEKHWVDSPKSSWHIRIKYILTPMALIDLVAILPFYLSVFFVVDLRVLRILRLLRILKLTRYSVAMKTLFSVLHEEKQALIAAYIIMFVLIVLASSGIYLLEHHIQPEHFGNIPSAMWWAVISLTTVGYGDVTPVTVGGKIFGGFISLIGIAMVALPTGIIASGFGNVFRRKRQRYELKMSKVIADGELTIDEIKSLKETQAALGLSDADAHQIYKEMVKSQLKHHLTCPNCGHATEYDLHK
jgi:voltage-gated potassium channel